MIFGLFLVLEISPASGSFWSELAEPACGLPTCIMKSFMNRKDIQNKYTRY